MYWGKYSTFALIILSIFLFGANVYAQSNSVELDELRGKIEDRASKIEALEEEIEKYEEELEVVGEEKATLQSAVKTLNLSQGKLQTEINITQNRVSATTFQISKLALEISDKEKRIELHSDTIAQSIRTINESDDLTFVEQVLSTSNFSDLWEKVEDLQRFQSNLQANLFELKSLKTELLDSKSEREARRRELINQNKNYTSLFSFT